MQKAFFFFMQNIISK